MTAENLIPSFPDLISIYAVASEVAHGTNDYQKIDEKYYSSAEREYAEEIATAKILRLVEKGHIRATGRMSETKKQGSVASWEAQQYKHHSKVRTYIEVEFWRNAVFTKSARLHTARIDGREYTDILLVLEDCREHLTDDIWAHRNSAETGEPLAVNDGYTTPYIDLMWQAIDHFEISRENQPIKDNLVEWFLAQNIAGQKISKATAEYLASFVRLPESRTGGNRPWKIRAQQNQKE